jgi:hypothetical protein
MAVPDRGAGRVHGYNPEPSVSPGSPGAPVAELVVANRPRRRHGQRPPPRRRAGRGWLVRPFSDLGHVAIAAPVSSRGSRFGGPLDANVEENSSDRRSDPIGDRPHVLWSRPQRLRVKRSFIQRQCSGRFTRGPRLAGPYDPAFTGGLHCDRPFASNPSPADPGGLHCGRTFASGRRHADPDSRSFGGVGGPGWAGAVSEGRVSRLGKGPSHPSCDLDCPSGRRLLVHRRDCGRPSIVGACGRASHCALLVPPHRGQPGTPATTRRPRPLVPRRPGRAAASMSTARCAKLGS